MCPIFAEGIVTASPRGDDHRTAGRSAPIDKTFGRRCPFLGEIAEMFPHPQSIVCRITLADLLTLLFGCHFTRRGWRDGQSVYDGGVPFGGS